MRTISAAALAALTGSVVRPFYLVSIELTSSTLYLSTLGFNVTWDGHTWLGNGFIKDPGAIRETGDLTAEGMEVQLCGEPSALVSIHLQSVEQNKAAKVYLGFLSAAQAVIADPILIFSGVVDNSKLVDAADTATLTFSLENDLADLDRPNDLRYNHESQKSLYALDLFFEYVEQLQNAHFYWGKKKRKNPKKNKKKGSE
jgi:hypothetical protein